MANEAYLSGFIITHFRWPLCQNAPMGGVHVTQHATDRWAERVVACSPTEAEAQILAHSNAIEVAAEFGAKSVKLGTKHRLILKGSTVLTVLPAQRHDPFAA